MLDDQFRLTFSERNYRLDSGVHFTLVCVLGDGLTLILVVGDASRLDVNVPYCILCTSFDGPSVVSSPSAPVPDMPA